MRGNRRTDSEVAANRAAVLALIVDGQMSATEAAHRLGIPERTARRLVGKARPPKVKPKFLPVEQCKPTQDELTRRTEWERAKHAAQVAENGGRRTLLEDSPRYRELARRGVPVGRAFTAFASGQNIDEIVDSLKEFMP